MIVRIDYRWGRGSYATETKFLLYPDVEMSEEDEKDLGREFAPRAADLAESYRYDVTTRYEMTPEERETFRAEILSEIRGLARHLRAVEKELGLNSAPLDV